MLLFIIVVFGQFVRVMLEVLARVACSQCARHCFRHGTAYSRRWYQATHSHLLVLILILLEDVHFRALYHEVVIQLGLFILAEVILEMVLRLVIAFLSLIFIQFLLFIRYHLRLVLPGVLFLSCDIRLQCLLHLVRDVLRVAVKEYHLLQGYRFAQLLRQWFRSLRSRPHVRLHAFIITWLILHFLHAHERLLGHIGFLQRLVNYPLVLSSRLLVRIHGRVITDRSFDSDHVSVLLQLMFLLLHLLLRQSSLLALRVLVEAAKEGLRLSYLLFLRLHVRCTWKFKCFHILSFLIFIFLF